MNSAGRLTKRFDDAYLFASELHRDQLRKGRGTPYLAHLLGVTSIAIDNGADEDTAIAALLHDAVEDQGGLPTLALIRERFGERVAAIVMECSDNEGHPKPPWKSAKDNFIASIPRLSPEARLVALADKLHNVRTLSFDYRTQGEALWGKFHGRRDGTLWYYRQAMAAFRSVPQDALYEELARAVNELFSLAGVEPL